MCLVLLRVLTGSLLLFGLAGCAQRDGQPDSSVTITSVAEGLVAAAPPGDACELLSDADVQRIFPGARGSQRDRTIEVLGMARCDWGAMNDGTNVTAGWLWKKPEADMNLKQRIAGTARMFSGLQEPEHLGLRFEPLSGMGDEAMMMIEPADPARGVLSSFAILVIRHGDQWVELRADPLAERDRTDALAALTELGRSAAGRLEAQASPPINNGKESP